MPNLVCQFESNMPTVFANYFCTDQTNMNQRITTRNLYDSAKIDVFLPNTDIVVGKQLFATVCTQETDDFSKCIQTASTSLAINYEGFIGTISFDYVVVDSVFLLNPSLSKVKSVSGIFNNINTNVFTIPSANRPGYLLYSIYTD